MRSKYLIKFDDQTTIVAYLWKNNNITNIKGTVQISHGMSEHILRYDDFANFLASHGYLVIGADHIAHGKTADSIDEIGRITKYDFMDAIIKGMKKVREELSVYFNYGTNVLFSHSMGSMASQRYIQLFPNDFNKVILCGTDIGSIKYSIAKLLLGLIIKIKGPLTYSKIVNKLTMESFNKKFVESHEKYGWLSSDSNSVLEYENDHYCGIDFPANYFYSLSKLLLKNKKRKAIKQINNKIKIFLISGTEDPVNHFGKSTKRLCALYKKFNIVTFSKIYPKGRHELLNEKTSVKINVYNDILNFLDNQ